MMMSAAKSGPMAYPPLPPTWKMLCAKPFLLPAATCATCDAWGWNMDDPHPIKATASITMA